MPRSKNPAVVNEKITPRQQALMSNVVTDTSDLDSQYKYLRLLQIKREMGVIDEDDYRALTESATGSALEKATTHIIKNLQRYSEFSPQLQQIFSVVGTSDKIQCARILAKRMIDAAATRRVLASCVGVSQRDLSGFGSSFVSADIGRSQIQLQRNPMQSADQRMYDTNAYRASLAFEEQDVV